MLHHRELAVQFADGLNREAFQADTRTVTR